VKKMSRKELMAQVLFWRFAAKLWRGAYLQAKDQRDEALSLAEAAYSKADRGEKMLRVAAAKADEARDDYERVCRAFAAKEGKK
jgi:hypothetical protein